jgi:hypothetical protein
VISRVLANKALYLWLAVATAASLAAGSSAASGRPDAGLQPTAKGKHCKKGKVLRKGKCVPKPKPGPAPLSDADGDGLPFKWEVATKVSAAASAKTPALAPLGANPGHKDVFLQIDYADEVIRKDMSCAELNRVVTAFADAPVPNPDGRDGISLRVDAGVSCPGHRYDLGESRVFRAGSCPGSSATINSLRFPADRIRAFHFAGFSPLCGASGEGGSAAFPGVTIAVFTSGGEFAHVLMHELGHNFGLNHDEYLPQRLSSMNIRLLASADGGTGSETVDYQRFRAPALDEHQLSEAAGISAPPLAHRFLIRHYCADFAFGPTFVSAWPGDGPIDWNCNSPPILLPGQSPTIDPGTVAADVNGDGKLTVLPAVPNEWLALDYGAGGQVGPR